MKSSEDHTVRLPMRLLKNTLRALIQHHTDLHASSRRRKITRNSLRVESLEPRTVLTAVAAPANLVSWWKAENSGADVMGLNNASLFNGATYAAGEVGKAFSFDGVNDRAQLNDVDTLKFTSSMTIESWIRVDSLTGGVIFFRGDDRGGLDPYNLSFDSNGNLQFAVTNSSSITAVVKSAVPLGQLIHIAATLDDASGDMRLYVNGAVVASRTTAIRPFRDLDPASNPSIGIGNHGGYPNTPHNFPFHGLIDELSVYNRALTPGEVLGIAKAGISGKVISPIVVDSPSVVEGMTGTTAPVTFTIQRTGSLVGSLTVAWATADDTATAAGLDYVSASGSLTFADGEATKTIQVTVNGDNAPESDESLKLLLTPGGGGTIMALGSILNDEAAISITNASSIEGNNRLKTLDRFVTDGSGGLARSKSSTFGPDGNLYVASSDTNAVLRYNGATGAFIDAFVPSGSGGLNGPVDVVFGPDGNLYVSSFFTNEVLRYDGVSGGFLGQVVSGLSTPIGITFGTDGALYIANQGTNEVLRYKDSSLSVFVTAGSGGLSQTRKAVFGPDGNLYVAGQGSGGVFRYNGLTGAFIGTFANTGSTSGPIWLQFGNDGYLYTSVRTASTGTDVSIVRFNATTGTPVDSFAIGRDGWSFNVGPGNIVYSSANSAGGFVDRIGPSSIETFTVSLNAASAVSTTVDYYTADGTAVVGGDYLATSGTLNFAPGETSKNLLVQTVNDTNIELAETFIVNLSNPVGGIVSTLTGTGTILDNDTKFYVVNDDTSNQTFEYGSNGASGESYGLNVGNTAPRGAASTAAGDKVWVVDANRNVYVYNVSGNLLGSWAAGSMNTTAQPEGVTTNGTDVWIVDNKTDQVFKYAGAASRLSGSQNANSSFSLNGGNSNPKGIVTDGTSIWVINDSTTDKVFKYSLAGAVLGSWTIDAANCSPTGLTIDPTNVSNIWTVDSGTDKVYQYTAAASRISGSQAAALTFALAAGNSNAQDIADPPVGLTPTPVVVANDSRPAAIAVSLQSPQVIMSIQPTTSNSLPREVAPNLQGVDEYMSAIARVASAPSSNAISFKLSETFNSMFDSSTDGGQNTDRELTENDANDLLLQLSHNLLQSNNRQYRVRCLKNSDGSGVSIV